ncbi:unnamed protein product [Bursaphelenchus xylophilus]|uniref:Serine palmitoyltransferase 1 n=1 Tax=Bursaphelenchus xylophilus TaxID=6326 RepID=A0A1I7SWA7_BURXY|nr:unnamed protein product [Bursaphelenchus xylophilus]CAG9099100.1 unnamed protein product [Bursaphelenchus xylophilus]
MEGLLGTVYDSVTGSPVHMALESAFVALFVYMIVFRKKKSKDDDLELSEEEKDKIISEWNPQPLVPEHMICNERNLSDKIEGKIAKKVLIEGKEYFNMATNNFLNFVGNEKIEAAAKKAIKQYGVGSCGPRSFYGTVDIHLEAEKKIAQFMGVEEAVLYSFGFATIASSIPAYSKRGDIIYADKACNFAIQKALQASRSRIEWFEHNDMSDLERLLKEQQEKDKKNPKKAQEVRKFIIIEGLYAKTADLCPLPRIMELKWKYKVRVFMDESLSFGVVGKRGRALLAFLLTSDYAVWCQVMECFALYSHHPVEGS